MTKVTSILKRELQMLVAECLPTTFSKKEATIKSHQRDCYLHSPQTWWSPPPGCRCRLCRLQPHSWSAASWCRSQLAPAWMLPTEAHPSAPSAHTPPTLPYPSHHPTTQNTEMTFIWSDEITVKKKSRSTNGSSVIDAYRFDIQQDWWLGDEGRFLGLFGCICIQTLLLETCCLLIFFITAKQVNVVIIIIIPIFHLCLLNWGSLF